MEFILKTALPVIIMVTLYIFIKLNSEKHWFKNSNFIKARIIIGSAGIGYFLALAIQSGKPKDIILTSLFALLLLYGVLSLQNKYTEIKKREP
jgi:hypothetical protein